MTTEEQKVVRMKSIDEVTIEDYVEYVDRLSKVEWKNVPYDTTRIMCELLVQLCRGSRCRCFCGCHTGSVTMDNKDDQDRESKASQTS